MTINDSHCHFFSSGFFAALARERGGITAPDPAGAITDLLEWTAPGDPPQLADRWVDELDRHGVTRAALIASVPGDEDAVAAALRAHPGRFAGLCMVDPTQADALGRVERAVGELGLSGVCLFPAMHHFELDDRRVREIAALLAGRDHAVLFVHCGALSLGVRKKLGLPSRFDVRLGDPLGVARLGALFPTIRLVVPHFGAGFFREALMAVDQCPNLYLDTSSSNGWTKYSPGLTLADVFGQALSVAGAHRLVFGTDSSFFPRGWQRPIWQAQRDVLAALGVSDADQRRIFSDNFDDLFGGRP